MTNPLTRSPVLNLYMAISILFTISLLAGCKKLEPERVLKVARVSITNISYSECTLEGTILDLDETGIYQYGFCWSTTQNPTVNDFKVELGEKNSTGKFSVIITRLKAGQTYFVRAYAENSEGNVYGDEESFSTTAVTVPILTTILVSSSITQNTALGGGNITSASGDTITARGVCWSISENPTIANSKTTDGKGTGEFLSSITGLMSNTVYNIRAFATNSAGTGYGNNIVFSTAQNTLPVVTTRAISSLSIDSVQTGGDITSDGGTTITFRGVCWDTSPNPTIFGDNKTVDGSGKGVFNSTIKGFTLNTTYYLRAYATNQSGTSYGNELNFNTLYDIPTISILSSPENTSHTSSIWIEVNGQNIIEKGIYYGENIMPDVSDNSIVKGPGGGTYLFEIPGLKAATKYYIRPYAKNTQYEVKGDQIDLTTLPMLFDVKVTPYELYNNCGTDGENYPDSHEICGTINTWENISEKVNLANWYNSYSLPRLQWTLIDPYAQEGTLINLNVSDVIGFDFSISDWDKNSTNDYLGSATGATNMATILDIQNNNPTSKYDGVYFIPHSSGLAGGCLTLTMKFEFTEK